MRDRPFFDTNVLVYSILTNDPRNSTARQVLAQDGEISVQVLNEFTSVSQRKLRRPWPVIRIDLDQFRTIFPTPWPLTQAVHDEAIRIAERDGLSIYDALIVASALDAGCDTLLTEDLQDGRIFDARLTVRNPFKASSLPADPAYGR